MFHHHKELAYTVRVDKPNPVFARMLQQAIGGPEGEMRVMNQYLFQAWGARGPKKYRDMLLHTGTEEIGHIEVLATAVAMNLDGLPSEKVDDVVTNPLVSARMGGVEPRHYLSGGLAAMPADANGVPFNANCIDVAGNLTANPRANVAAEAVGRTLASRLREMTDDPGMKDMLSFLIARDTMHQQQWLAAIEDIGDTFQAAPNDVLDEGDYKQYAYAFFGHGDEPMDAAARWLSGSVARRLRRVLVRRPGAAPRAGAAAPARPGERPRGRGGTPRRRRRRRRRRRHDGQGQGPADLIRRAGGRRTPA